jgi:hypothetical protein
VAIDYIPIAPPPPPRRPWLWPGLLGLLVGLSAVGVPAALMMPYFTSFSDARPPAVDFPLFVIGSTVGVGAAVAGGGVALVLLGFRSARSLGAGYLIGAAAAAVLATLVFLILLVIA